MRYPYEVVFQSTQGTFKSLCETWSEVERSLVTYGVDKLLEIRENH